MRKWTVEVNIDGGFFERQITFVIEAPTSKQALDNVRANMRSMGFRTYEYQAHVV